MTLTKIRTRINPPLLTEKQSCSTDRLGNKGTIKQADTIGNRTDSADITVSITS